MLFHATEWKCCCGFVLRIILCQFTIFGSISSVLVAFVEKHTFSISRMFSFPMRKSMCRWLALWFSCSFSFLLRIRIGSFVSPEEIQPEMDGARTLWALKMSKHYVNRMNSVVTPLRMIHSLTAVEEQLEITIFDEKNIKVDLLEMGTFSKCYSRS